MILLSVLMATTADREPVFTPLYNELMSQVAYCQTVHPSLGRVEVLVDSRPRFLDGGPSIGAKRDALLQKASGKYVCYLDSDEAIAPNYLETLMRLCYGNPDCVTFRNLTKTDGYWTVIDMSLKHEDEEASPDRIIKRGLWHINPIRSSYAKLIPFPDTNWGEDAAWIAQVKGYCQTEAKTDAIIHCYQHSASKSESDKIVKHQSTNA